jgi:FKBP-type peptidyl-prolyl cis-trans isomerase 2
MARSWKIGVVLPLMLAGVGAWQALGSAAEDPHIVQGSKVTFMYVITIPGDVGVRLSDVGQFVHGQHQILPSLERQLDGMKPGDEKQVELSPAEGFGTYDANKRKNVARSDLPAEAKQGDVLKDREGNLATVTEMTDSAALLDFNHPLAGKNLLVQIKILQVENPS